MQFKQIKQEKTGIFDITMGSYDGAEACELIGAYMIDRLKVSMLQSRLGLCIIPNWNGPKIEKIKENITKIIKDEGLNSEYDGLAHRTRMMSLHSFESMVVNSTRAHVFPLSAVTPDLYLI